MTDRAEVIERAKAAVDRVGASEVEMVTDTEMRRTHRKEYGDPEEWTVPAQPKPKPIIHKTYTPQEEQPASPPPLPPYVDEKFLDWYTQGKLDKFADMVGAGIGDLEKKLTQRDNETSVEVTAINVQLQIMISRISALEDRIAGLEGDVAQVADVADAERSTGSSVIKLRGGTA